MHRELLQQAGEDEEELAASQRLARTRPLPHTERHHGRIRAQADSMLASFSTPSNKKNIEYKTRRSSFLIKLYLPIVSIFEDTIFKSEK